MLIIDDDDDDDDSDDMVMMTKRTAMLVRTILVLFLDDCRWLMMITRVKDK